MPNNSRVVSWDFTPGVEIPKDALLSIQWARAGGQWQTLAQDLNLVCSYIDQRITNRNKYNNDYYRIILKTADGQQYISQPEQAGINLSYPYSAQANNLNRLSSLQLAKTGRQGFLMKKIMYGQKCPVCKQFEDDGPVNQHCPVCLGTGIKDGYYKAIPMPILQQGESIHQDITETGYITNAIMAAKCVAWPIIQIGDVWADKYTNQRYYIQTASPISKYKHIPLIYSLKMHLIEQSDIIHSKPVNDALQEAFVSGNSDWEKAFE